MLIYDLQPFVSFKHAAIDLLQEISGDIAPCKIPLGTQDGERVEGAAFIDGLIEAECDLRNDASKTRNILKRILDRISSGRAMLARCPAICLGIGWLPVASVIRISLEPTRRSVTIVELEGPLFVQNYIPGSLAMHFLIMHVLMRVHHGGLYLEVQSYQGRCCRSLGLVPSWSAHLSIVTSLVTFLMRLPYSY